MNIGRDRLFCLLRHNRLLVAPKRAYHKTTNSHHRFRRHPNLIKEGFVAQRPNQLWVADITYLPTRAGESYLSLVTDAYSRKIVGYSLDDNMKTVSVKKAFHSALTGKRSSEKLIHHSDRGIQYCSAEYQRLHEKYGVSCSMTDGYDCYQNALAERVNGILKKNTCFATCGLSQTIHRNGPITVGQTTAPICHGSSHCSANDVYRLA